jgi:hypothetical protein
MYAQLDSPLPGLTVTSTGERCCGMRGAAHLGFLGDVPVDTVYTDPGGGLVDPTTFDPTVISPIIDTGSLPLTNIVSPSLDSMYPSTIGTEFTSNGDGTYTNIQTGQSVPYDTAAAITQATTGPATVNLNTVATEQNVSLIDPTTGQTSTISTNNLSAAAQALQAAGQLVNSVGKLTAQGQALLAQGNLYNTLPHPSATAGFSNAMSSLTSWFTESTLFPGFPNYGVVGIVVVVLGIGMSYMESRPTRRKR